MVQPRKGNSVIERFDRSTLKPLLWKKHQVSVCNCLTQNLVSIKLGQIIGLFSYLDLAASCSPDFRIFPPSLYLLGESRKCYFLRSHEDMIRFQTVYPSPLMLAFQILMVMFSVRNAIVSCVLTWMESPMLWDRAARRKKDTKSSCSLLMFPGLKLKSGMLENP